MMHIDLEQLITFERIVREGSFSAAALALDIPQPTVSGRIKALEHTLGGSLFHRGGRQVALTDLGQTFLPYARRTIAVLTEGVEMARQSKQGQRGRVTYGGLISMMGALVGPSVAHFYSSHPNVEIIVKTGDHESVVDWLRDRIVELGLLVWPCQESIATPMQPLLRLRESVVLAVGESQSLAQRSSITYAELLSAAHPFLLTPIWPTPHPTVAQIADQAESTLSVSMTIARHMLKKGIGIGFFPRTFILDDLKSGTLVELTVYDLKQLYRDMALVWLPRATPLSVATESFVECLRLQALRLERDGLDVLPGTVAQ